MQQATLETRTLGRSGLTVSALGLGCMGMSNAYGPAGRADCIATIRHALDRGVFFFDTADAYGGGHNETLVGEALTGLRDQVVLATKFGIEVTSDGTRRINGRPEYVRACAESSLRRLDTDVIDVYYQHRVDKTVPIEDTVGAMSELVTEGKVRYLGLSQASARSIERAVAVHPVAALQTEWSIWTRELEGDVLETARRLGLGIVAYCPLGRGFLAGAVTDRGALGPDDARFKLPRFAQDNLPRNVETLEQLQGMAAARGITAAQLALAWVLSRGPDVAPIPGTKRIKYLDENVDAAEVRLTPDEIALLDGLSPETSWAGQRSSGKLTQGFGDSPERVREPEGA
jgi:aryl-alcohol dehydrogenase-like predicted oxidoreductase